MVSTSNNHSLHFYLPLVGNWRQIGGYGGHFFFFPLAGFSSELEFALPQGEGSANRARPPALARLVCALVFAARYVQRPHAEFLLHRARRYRAREQKHFGIYAEFSPRPSQGRRSTSSVIDMRSLRHSLSRYMQPYRDARV